MQRHFSLTLTLEGGDNETLQGELTESEYKVLIQFLDQYEQLAQSKPLREGFPCELSFKYNENCPLQVEAKLPDSDTLSILLHRLRPFVLDAEPASYRKVNSIIGRRVESDLIRGMLRDQRRLYDGHQFNDMIRIISNEVQVNTERVLYDWLNSHEYHRDLDKREAVDALLVRTPGDSMKAILVSMLVDKVHAIQYLASLSALLLGKSQRLSFSVRKRSSGSGVDEPLAS